MSGPVLVTATASDNVGVSKVEFYLDGIWQRTDSSAPYSWSWDTTRFANRSYTLVAKAYDAAGNVGTSSPVTVTVNNGTPDTTPPTISSVQASTTSTTATITWVTNEPANSQLEYGLSPCPCSFASPFDATLVINHSITLTGLSPSTTYYYRVYSRDVSRNLAISGTNTFWTTLTGNIAPSVSLGRPNGGENWPVGSVQTITWSATDDVAVTSVSLFYSTDGGLNWTAIATGIANSGSYAWTIPNTPSTTVRIGVVARDGAGMTGEDSSDGNFTISPSCSLPAAPVLQDIAVTSGSYTVAWGMVSVATSYILEEDTASAFTNPTRFYLTSIARFFSGISPGTNYYRVKAVSSCGEGAWSGTKAATVSYNYVPGPITAVSPPDGAIDQPLSLILCWSASHPGGESLRFNVYLFPAEIGYFSTDHIKSFSQTSTCYAASNLPYNTTVSWGVEAIDDTGDVRFSPMFHFKTITDTSKPTGAISINNGAATTDSYNVTLYLSASDTGSGVQYMRFSNDGTTWSTWYFYALQFPWNLANSAFGGRYGLTTYTVHAQFRDQQGNESVVYSDMIDKLPDKPGHIILRANFYETIEDAMAVAQPGDIVYLTEGTYVIRPSEKPPRFPTRSVGIVLNPGVTLMGAGAQKTTVILQGTGLYTIIDADNAVIEGLTVINSDTGGVRHAVLLESNASKIRHSTVTGSFGG
ncbi:MAG: fibronectin type III domain-containing protein, partial [Nitrospinae bacterium]|nr:fibronectin type III domain-containing protein [Nitrospinota bacterium]